MSASVKSLKSVSTLINRPQGGGPKKQGLVSSATGDSGLTVVQYNMTCCNQRWGLRYRPGIPVPQTWHNYKAVGSTTIINGMRVMM